MNDPVRRPGNDPMQIDPRIGGLRTPSPADVEKPGSRKRLRDRIPTMAQLEALIQDGRLILPVRYFRGYFLDVLA